MNLHQKGPATVLVVDDDGISLMSAVRTVENCGYLSLSASNAEEALALLRGRDTIDVLFTDINMPGLMDGVALAQEGRRLDPEIGILITSGRPFPADDMMPTGGSFLHKPYGPSQIAIALSTMIDQSRPFAV
jgi:CheY-like chemotaxis protein